MSKEKLDAELKPNEFNVIKVTDKNIHLISKDILEAAEYIDSEIKKGRIFFPKKYFAAQKSNLIWDTNELFKNAPDLSLKQVLFKIMEPLPDFLPADNLVEVTKIITSTWVKLQQKVAA